MSTIFNVSLKSKLILIAGCFIVNYFILSNKTVTIYKINHEIFVMMPTNLLSSQFSGSLKVQEHKLSNGMTVWLNEDHSQPKVFGAVLVKAGAKDSPNTGIAHYFEHMMFKGTDKIGTLDYEKEKILLDAIADQYDELAKTVDKQERFLILQKINELSIQASDYVIPNEFDRLVSKYGGTKLNAGTSYDYTVYFNTFSPQYIQQWSEINSERLMNPVFRLFQSELETVYEEKNMYSDFVGSQAVEKLTEHYFYPHPYAYPILGSTENLKNPRLSEMKKFFEVYYVASNMGLILSGAFKAEKILPVLEQTFARIRDAKVPLKKQIELPPFSGKEKIQVKVPIPFVKAMVIGFRGVPANHKDEVALKIAVALLSNPNGTGYLDKLVVEHKVLAAMALSESMNEAGILGVLVVPKLIIQTYKAAEKMVWKAINKVRNGNFSDEVFQSLKLTLKREYISELEDINSRAQLMMRIYSQGKSWQDYLNNIANIDSLSKEDIVAIGNKYFNENYLYATKKTGRYPKDNLPKPNYKPILFQNRNAVSEYARELEKLPIKKSSVRFIDFEKDVKKTDINPFVTLYNTINPINDIFSLKILFGVGVLEKPILRQMVAYLSLVGTQCDSFERFRNKLQMLGGTLSFDVSDNDFSVYVKGMDANFRSTLKLVGEFMRSVEIDDEKVKQIAEDAKVVEKAFLKSGESMGKALLEKVKYGNQSRYLQKMSLSEIKKIKGKNLVDAFMQAQQVEANVHYCGRRAIEDVKDVLQNAVTWQIEMRPSQSPYYMERKEYPTPLVYFYEMPDVSQSIIYGYVKGMEQKNEECKYASKLFSYYLGGDMSSLMFQEIREFRSFAYRVNSQYSQPIPNQKNRIGDLVTMLSTQSDKTVDALIVLDSLLKELPVYPERMEAMRQTISNQINNDYPSFRDISTKIAMCYREGYSDDPNKSYLDYVRNVGMDVITAFYHEQIKGRPVVYAIVGNSKQIDMGKLAEFGAIIKLKKNDIYK